MVQIDLLGGIGEIGGNKFLVEDSDSRILLDFGMSLGMRGQFFSEPFLSPRDRQGLVTLGILPDIHGLYRDEENTHRRRSSQPRSYRPLHVYLTAEQEDPGLLWGDDSIDSEDAVRDASERLRERP